MKTEPSRQQKTRRTSRGASTRKRIVEATSDLTYAKGVEGTTLEDVCASAGVSKSQLYHYFADKDALIREVILEQTARVLAAQGTALMQLDSLAALRRWRDSILALNRAVGNSGCPLGSLASELANHSEQARALLVAGFKTWEDRLAEGFARMQETGELAASVVPRDLAIGVLSTVEGGLLLAKTSRNEGPLKVALDMALHHVATFRRLRPSAASGQSRPTKKRRS